MREINRYKFPLAKQMSYRYEMYSAGNMVNDSLIPLYDDIFVTRLIRMIILQYLQTLNHYVGWLKPYI